MTAPSPGAAGSAAHFGGLAATRLLPMPFRLFGPSLGLGFPVSFLWSSGDSRGPTWGLVCAIGMSRALAPGTLASLTIQWFRPERGHDAWTAEGTWAVASGTARPGGAPPTGRARPVGGAAAAAATHPQTRRARGWRSGCGSLVRCSVSFLLAWGWVRRWRGRARRRLTACPAGPVLTGGVV